MIYIMIMIVLLSSIHSILIKHITEFSDGFPHSRFVHLLVIHLFHICCIPSEKWASSRQASTFQHIALKLSNHSTKIHLHTFFDHTWITLRSLPSTPNESMYVLLTDALAQK